MTKSLSSHRVELARDLLDDIELSRLGSEALLLKARRLSRLMETAEIDEWLRYELNGYSNTVVGRKYMTRLGRWTDEKNNFGYWQPLAGIEGTIAAMQVQIQQLKVPDVQFAPSSSNPNEFVLGFGVAEKFTEPAKNVLSRLTALTSAVSTLRSIRSRALAALHDFVTGTYYELAFSSLAEAIFSNHKTAIDSLLAARAGEAIRKVPAIYGRLAEGDSEAISQALNSCRRMIKSFADAMYPAQEGSVEMDGQSYQVGSDKVLNRIKLYLRDHCASSSRRDRLNMSIRDIYDRASAGSHSDVTGDEARSLFLATYLSLGEILLACGAQVAEVTYVEQPVVQEGEGPGGDMQPF